MIHGPFIITEFIDGIIIFCFPVVQSIRNSSLTPAVCNVTNEEGPQKNKSCVFPFRFRDTVYTECTDVSDREGKFWCSTKVDNNGNHIGQQGNYGFCDERCKFGYKTFGNES